jgi:hypothetical protein
MINTFSSSIYFYLLFRSSEIDEFNSEQIPITTESNISQIQEQLQRNNNINPIEINNYQQATSDESDNQSLKITIKFLNDTQKEISANLNDTISKVKQ